MKKIFLLRHGHTVLDGRYVGATDAALSEKGVEEVIQLRPFFTSVVLDSIIVSPLKRCIDTCELLNLNAPYSTDDALREIHFGRWEGMTFNEISAKDEQLINEWGQNPAGFTFPQGECVADFAERVSEFSQRLKKIAGSTILVISHGGVIPHILCDLLELPSECSMKFKIETGKLAILNITHDLAVLLALNSGVYHG